MPKRTTDTEFLKRLEERAPEVLSARVNFDALVGKVLATDAITISHSPNRSKPKSKATPKSNPKAVPGRK